MSDENTTFSDLEAHFQKDEAFAPVEMFNLQEIVAVTTVPMPEQMLSPRGIDSNSENYKSHFPNGIPCVDIAVKGIDVEYAFAEDRILHITIPMVNFQGDNIGEPKGERSQLDITHTAFKAVFGVGLFGTDARAKLAGLKARWGQHIDKAVIQGQVRPWRWSIPRETLPADFKFEGDIRVVTGKSTRTDAAAGVVHEAMGDDEARAAVLRAVVGMPTNEPDKVYDVILALKGLPNEIVNSALERELMKKLNEEELVDVVEGAIQLTDKGKALVEEHAQTEEAA